jgi:hypothetical protein
MKNIKISTLISFFILIVSNLYAQSSDIITLKKRNGVTKKTYFAGSQIEFIDLSGSFVKGSIKKIERDSLFINLYDTRKQYTIWGTSFWDTISVFTVQYHYKDIRELIKPEKGFNFIRNGLLFTIVGTGYAFLHIFNAVYLKEKLDAKTLGISGAAVLSGLLLKKLDRSTIRMGKQYYLQYIPTK